MLPIYVFDRRLLDGAGPHRRRRLIASVAALADELRSLGGSLTVTTGDPAEAVARLARDHRVDAVVWNNDVTRFAERATTPCTTVSHNRASRSSGCGARSFIRPARSSRRPGACPACSAGSTNVGPRPRSASRRAPAAARILSIPGESLPPIDGTAPIAPGSEGAASRLAAFLERVDGYDVERDLPGRDATSHLSADLRFGTISPRQVVRAVGGSTPGREAFARQLAWRDWYAHLFAERPDLVDHAQQPQYDAVAWRSDPAEVQAWKQGRTGYPIVDAGMRELAHTGWMPNRLRLITASFLVKDLLADWRIGERHFRHLLIDGDIPQNAGNWQWVAGTGSDAAPYFRVLNPLTQARRFDPDGDYVRRLVPELAALPGASIHAPWEVGPLELASVGVVLGDTYPHPIVDHAPARERAIAAYATAKTVRW